MVCLFFFFFFGRRCVWFRVGPPTLSCRVVGRFVECGFSTSELKLVLDSKIADLLVIYSTEIIANERLI